MDYIIKSWLYFKYAFLHEQKEKKTYFPSKEKMSVLQTTSQTSSTCQKDFQEDRNPLPSKQQQTQSKSGGKQRKQHTAWFYLNYFSVCPEHTAAFSRQISEHLNRTFLLKCRNIPLERSPKKRSTRCCKHKHILSIN